MGGHTDSVINFYKKLLVTMFSKGRAMETLKGIKTSTYTLEELMGPLNDVEKKFAPKELHVAGDLPIPLQSPRSSVIGSRKASQEGLKAASDIARTLVRGKAIVVSGLAEGIDTSAHKAAIEEGGCTIAVLGTPLDRVYPQKTSDFKRLLCATTWPFLNFQLGIQLSRRISFFEID